MSLLTTASAVYTIDKNGEIGEVIPRKGRSKPIEKRFFSKLNQTITPEDIEREKDYQQSQRKLNEWNTHIG